MYDELSSTAENWVPDIASEAQPIYRLAAGVASWLALWPIIFSSKGSPIKATCASKEFSPKCRSEALPPPVINLLLVLSYLTIYWFSRFMRMVYQRASVKLCSEDNISKGISSTLYFNQITLLFASASSKVVISLFAMPSKSSVLYAPVKVTNLRFSASGTCSVNNCVA